MSKYVIIGLSVLTAGVLSASAAESKELFEKNCAKCHAADGKGRTKIGQKLGIKDLTDAKVQAELKDDAAFKAIKQGIKDGDKTLMKPVEGLTDEQIKGLVAYVRSLGK